MFKIEDDHVFKMMIKCARNDREYGEAIFQFNSDLMCMSHENNKT